MPDGFLVECPMAPKVVLVERTAKVGVIPRACRIGHRAACAALLACVFSSLLFAGGAEARGLSFEERVAAQRAIEQVYWNHRIWPRDPGSKPVLSAVMTDEAIRAKVEDYLKESNALETWWHRPITAA